jgi:hypothetical protein
MGSSLNHMSKTERRAIERFEIMLDVHDFFFNNDILT